MVLLVSGIACASCGTDASTLVGHWKGTYACDFPEHSSVKVPKGSFPVEYTFTTDGRCIRQEPTDGPTPRVDTTAYEVKDGMIVWDHGDEASEELDVQLNGDIVLTYDNGFGGTCRTELEKVAP